MFSKQELSKIGAAKNYYGITFTALVDFLIAFKMVIITEQLLIQVHVFLCSAAYNDGIINQETLLSLNEIKVA